MSERVLMDSRDAAAYLCVARQTLARWRVEGGGPVFLKLGALVRYDVDDLDGWLDAQRRQTTSDAAKEHAA